MSDLLPCNTSAPILECCVVPAPNVSEWLVICPRGALPPAAPTQVPVLSWLGVVIFAVLISSSAISLLRTGR